LQVVLVFLPHPHPLTDHQALFNLVESLSGPEDLEAQDRVQVSPKENNVDPKGIDQGLEFPNHVEVLVRERHLGKLDGDVQVAMWPRPSGATAEPKTTRRRACLSWAQARRDARCGIELTMTEG